MLDAIEFMERMGGDAQLSQASPRDLAVAMEASGIAPELQSVLRDGDTPRLNALLGTSPGCALVAPPEPPGPPPDPSEPYPAMPPPPPPPPPPLFLRRKGFAHHKAKQPSAELSGQ